MSTNQGKKAVLPHQSDPALLESYRYINTMPGKNVRGKMIDCFQLWMKVDNPEVLDAIKVNSLCFDE
jgi:geranylgeranyl diphosphate synthase type 3